MKKFYFFAPVFLCFLLVVAPITDTIKLSNSINNKILRLHILANSDDNIDQDLKLKVRDELLRRTGGIFENCSNLEEALKLSKNNLKYLKSIAEDVVKENGFNYNVEAIVDKEFFDVRHYNSFSLPSGVYNTIKIILGKGEGHNWWCVMYPSVCLSGCTNDFDSVLTDDEKALILDRKYIPKLKIVEIYKKIKNSVLTMN